jgi:hypothetical protein
MCSGNGGIEFCRNVVGFMILLPVLRSKKAVSVPFEWNLKFQCLMHPVEIVSPICCSIAYVVDYECLSYTCPVH